MASNQLPLFIGLRYSFSRQRNRFIGVVSMVSLLGMAIGVASLITVLAVMNGFAGELRGRILSLVPHGYVQPQYPAHQRAAREALRAPERLARAVLDQNLPQRVDDRVQLER